MLEHPKAQEMDRKFQEIYEEVDRELERLFGCQFELHPSRPMEGATANPQMDGLFDFGATFSPGYGSKWGRGYVLDLKVVTLESVPQDIMEKYWKVVVELLQEKLDREFPQRNMKIFKDGTLYKIVGDFSLGSIF